MVERYRKPTRLGQIDSVGAFLNYDNELIFDVNTITASNFAIPVNGYGGTTYDWNITIDGGTPTRYSGSKSTTPINIALTVGTHTIKITPYGTPAMGWGMCLGNGTWSNYWSAPSNHTFSLRVLPLYAFINTTNAPHNVLYLAWYGCNSITSGPILYDINGGLTSVGYSFLYYTRSGCTSLASMPSGFNLPTGLTSVGGNFLYYTRYGCTSLASMPSGFNLPTGITSVGDNFLSFTRRDCTSLTSNAPNAAINFPNVNSSNYGYNCFGGSCPITPDTPTPGSSVLVKRL